MSNPAHLINKCFTGKNVMTPNIEKYLWIVEDKLACEVSTGSGFNGELIVGVSLAERLENGDIVSPKGLSKMCFSMTGAEEYIEELKQVREEKC